MVTSLVNNMVTWWIWWSLGERAGHLLGEHPLGDLAADAGHAGEEVLVVQAGVGEERQLCSGGFLVHVRLELEFRGKDTVHNTCNLSTLLYLW